MHPKLLTLFAFAVAASAQTFLQPDFYIISKADDSLRVDVEGESKEAGAHIILTPPKLGLENSQLWVYNNQTGTLTNLLVNGTEPNIVLSAPVTAPGGDVILGQPLTQEVKIEDFVKSFHQLWDYTDDQHVVPLANTNYCMAASEDTVVMAKCDKGNDAHRWTLVEGP